MKTNNKKQILYILLFILSISFVSASIENFVNSLTYDYNTEQINVTSFSDILIDADSDGTNDTLKITLSTNGTAGTYLFICDLDDEGGIISSTTNNTVSASDSVDINISTKLFSQDKFNYSIRIYNSSNMLIYRKDKKETSLLQNYELGVNITSISDQNIGNSFIRVTLGMDVSDNDDVNITVILKYNDSYISSTKEISLTTPTQSEDIDFDNETIKETHYSGKFLIDYIKVGDKVIDTNQNTSSYDYETFAKTSYIKSFSDGGVDTDADDLLDSLEINLTINVKYEDTYSIEIGLYDLYDNYVANLSKSQSLSVANQTIQMRFNGSDIYSNKIDGPYLIQYAKLIRNEEIIDFLSEPHTTNDYYYTDFERPPLPDLTLSINASFDDINNITKTIVNLSNIGEAPAFNVFLDIFDNLTYQNNRSLAFMNINEHILYEFNITNSTNTSLITALVDFSNIVDESDETNNIVNNQQAGDGVIGLSLITPTSNSDKARHSIFEFSVNVSCSGGDCGEINVSLDPIKEETTKSDSSVIAKFPKIWRFEKVEEDPYVDIYFEQVSENELILTIDKKQDVILPKDYRWHISICDSEDLNDIKYVEDLFFGLKLTKKPKSKKLSSQDLPSNWCDISNNKGYVISSNKNKDKLPKKIKLIIPNNADHFRIHAGSETVTVDASSDSVATRYGFNENFCITPSGTYHTAYADSSDKLGYAKSTDDGSTWSPSQLFDSRTVKNVGILCAPNGSVIVYFISDSGTKNLSMMQSDNDGASFSNSITVAEYSGSEYVIETSGTIDSRNIAHWCYIDAVDDLWYVNSSDLSEIEISSSDSDHCDIEVDANDNVFIPITDTSTDDLQVMSSTDGWSSRNTWDTGSSVSSSPSHGPSIAVCNNGTLYLAWVDSNDLQFCEGDVDSWTASNHCQELDASGSYYVDIAASYECNPYITYNTGSGSGDIVLANRTDGGSWQVRNIIATSAIYSSIGDSMFPTTNRMRNTLHYVFTNLSMVYYDSMTIEFTPFSIPKNGLISTEQGATPFFVTNTSNPQTIELNADESQTVTFWVNATGSVYDTYEFFAFANITASPEISNRTNTINITIN